MRVLIAAGIYPPDIGGPATYAREMAHALRVHGHTVAVITYGEQSRPQDEAKGVAVYRIARRGAFRTAVEYFFKLASFSQHYDVLFAQGPVAGGMQCMLLRFLRGTPYVVKVTGDYAWEQAQAQYGMTDSIEDFQKKKSGMPLKVRLLRFIQSQVARRAIAVVVPSMFLQRLVVSWGVDERRCQVIYNGVQQPLQQDDPPAAVQSSMAQGAQLVVSAGRLVPWKGFETLIKVWKDVAASVPGARLCVLGTGPGEAALRQLLAKEGIQDTVRLLPARGTEVRGTFRIASVFILNSSYEGFSHTILEAQAAGCACAVSRVGGNPELVDDGQTGILFAYNDAAAIRDTVIRLLRDEQLRKRLGAAAAVAAAKFTVERMYQETEALLKHVTTAAAAEKKS